MYWIKQFYYDDKENYYNLEAGTLKHFRSDIDPIAYQQWLAVRCVYEPRTIFKNVFKFTYSNEPEISYKFPQMLIDQKPQNKYAILLSGGVDSSILSTLYDNPDTTHIFVQTLLGKERPYYDMVAKNLKGKKEIIIITSEQFYEYAKEIYGYIKEPVGDAAIVSVYAGAKRCKELGYDYLVIGEGGDESFAGYWGYPAFFKNYLNNIETPLQQYWNHEGVATQDKIPSEILNYFNFIEPETLRNNKGENTLRKVMRFDRWRGIWNNFLWKNIYGCELAGIKAVLPFCHSNIWWWTTHNLKDSDLILGNKKKAFLKDYALSLGLPQEAILREKSGFRSEADEKVAEWMKADLPDDKKAFADTSHSAMYATWALERWLK